MKKVEGSQVFSREVPKKSHINFTWKLVLRNFILFWQKYTIISNKYTFGRIFKISHNSKTDGLFTLFLSSPTFLCLPNLLAANLFHKCFNYKYTIFTFCPSLEEDKVLVYGVYSSRFEESTTTDIVLPTQKMPLENLQYWEKNSMICLWPRWARFTLVRNYIFKTKTAKTSQLNKLLEKFYENIKTLLWPFEYLILDPDVWTGLPPTPLHPSLPPPYPLSPSIFIIVFERDPIPLPSLNFYK